MGEREEQRSRDPGASNFGGGLARDCGGKSGKVQGGKQTKNEHGGADDAGQFSTCIHCNHLPVRFCVCVGQIEMYGKRNRGKENPVGGGIRRGAWGKRKLSLENKQRIRRGKNQSFIRHITLDSLRKCQKPLALQHA